MPPVSVDVVIHRNGPALWDGRYSAEQLEKIRSVLGSKHFNALYQQNPIDDEGAMFPRNAWQWYEWSDLPELREIIIAVDSAFKDGVGNDWSVFAVWGHDGFNSYYLLDLWRGRVEFPELIEAGDDIYAKWLAKGLTRKFSLVVEDKASGQSAIQVWRRPHYSLVAPEAGERPRLKPALAVQAFAIKGAMSKDARADGVTPLVKGKRVYLPHSRTWTDAFVQEHVEFPFGTHDDQVDSTSIALSYFLFQPKRGMATF